MRTHFALCGLMIVLTSCGRESRGEGAGKTTSRTPGGKAPSTQSHVKGPLILTAAEKRLAALHELLTPRGDTPLEVTSLIRRFVADTDNELKYEGRGAVQSFPVRDAAGRLLALLVSFKATKRQGRDDDEETDEYAEYKNWRSWLVYASSRGTRSERLIVSRLEEVVLSPTKISTKRWRVGTTLITFTYKAKYDSSCCDDRGGTKGDGDELSEGVGEALVLLHGGICHSLISHILEQERVTGWGMRIEKVEYRWVWVKGSSWPYLFYEKRHLTTGSVPSEEDGDDKMEQRTTCERKTELLRVTPPRASGDEVLTPLTAQQILTLSKKNPILTKFPSALSTFKEPEGVCGELE